ncbi:hypothetical protein MKQ70_18395 [Chitinophaga sedimenti]|uniref:hypothetical protein n=1 Tax=Chitinophaga sedimenti TaxID=2033606 RepID=UPI002005685C|nr:hypothetical protein [Chitinophaga sedimenti]MCK7556878.1 hypothetical protein [Chitinophaga sedimenti]
MLKKIDSLLYENIPGRIISKENITNNGYPGYDIQSRTRRGDLQRYQLFVTPFEVLVFKMSGNKDYAAGEEAKRFFSSIKLTPLPATRWTTFTAPSNLFSIQLPHTPHIGENGSRRDISKRTEYEALDKNTGNSYMVTVFNAPGNARLMEDSVEMGFAEESLQQSEFVKQQESRKFMQHRGYPCLEIVNLNNDLSHTRTRIILQGIHYYVISARYKKDKNTTQAFFDSFNPAVSQYYDFSEYKDSILLFTVKTPVKPADSEEQLAELMGVGLGEEDDEDRSAYLNTARTFSSDSTGEQVTVLYNRYGKYFHIKDSAGFWKNLEAESTNDGDMILALKKYERLPGYESLLITTRDTNCSRALMQKSFLKNNMLYTLVAVTDTLNGPSDFVRTFFETFTPADTANNNAIYTSKAPLLFKDFYSADSITRKQARKRYMHVQYDDNDADTLIAMLNRWTPAEKNYRTLRQGSSTSWAG